MPCGLDPSFFSRFLESIQVDKDLEVLMIRDKVGRLLLYNYAVCV